MVHITKASHVHFFTSYLILKSVEVYKYALDHISHTEIIGLNIEICSNNGRHIRKIQKLFSEVLV